MTAASIVVVVIIPLILAEVGPWCGWLAARLLKWAAKLRYADTDRARIRLVEWSDDLSNIPGQLSKLAYAVGQLAAGSVVSVRQKSKSARSKTKVQGLTGPIEGPSPRLASLPAQEETRLRVGTERVYRRTDLTAQGSRSRLDFEWHGARPSEGRHWAYSKENLDRMYSEGRIEFSKTGRPFGKRYLDEQSGPHQSRGAILRAE